MFDIVDSEANSFIVKDILFLKFYLINIKN